jgi:hypothetical protein
MRIVRAALEFVKEDARKGPVAVASVKRFVTHALDILRSIFPIFQGAGWAVLAC